MVYLTENPKSRPTVNGHDDPPALRPERPYKSLKLAPLRRGFSLTGARPGALSLLGGCRPKEPGFRLGWKVKAFAAKAKRRSR